MMKKKEKITLVIITRNRSASLAECLNSIVPQMSSSEEILVIDNNSDDNTRDIVHTYAKLSKARLKYIQEPNIGVSICRNRGINEAKNHWVAFIDDDCVVTKNWTNRLHQSLKRHPRATAIVGPNVPYDIQNPYSLTAAFLYDFWIKQNLKGNAVYNYEMLDTKNVIFNKNFLDKNSIRFDTKLRLGEDCDLGIQIEKHGGVAYYNPHMVVTHKHPTTFHKYVINQLAYSLSAVQILIKWQPRQTVFANNVPVVSFFYDYAKQLRHKRDILPLLIIITSTMLMNKILFFVYNFGFVRRAFEPITDKIFSIYINRN